MKIRTGLMTAGLIFMISGIIYSQKQDEKCLTEVIILHTNDMHAQIDNMAKLAYLVDSLKKSHPYVFLVSAGDNFTGNPVVDKYYEKGYPMIDLMNRCGFDVSAFGNHEFDLGQENLAKRIKEARFPFICCNFDSTGNILERPEPNIILDAGEDIKIAILGIIQRGPSGKPESHLSKLAGLTFTDGVTAAKQYADLKTEYGNLIGLTHLGIETDTILARVMPDLDLIIGGHSHDLIDTVMMVNGVRIVQAGSKLHFAGKTTLLFSEGRMTGCCDENISLNSIRNYDKEIQAVIDQYNTESNVELKKVVGVAETPVKGFDGLGNLMTDALKYHLNVDFAFLNKGGIRIDMLPKGNITKYMIYKLDPFENEVITFTMTAKEIKSFICNAYNREKSVDLAVSGMKYYVSIDSNKYCTGVDMYDCNDHFVDTTRNYKVALNSYLATDYKFTYQGSSVPSGLTSDEILIKYIENVKKIRDSNMKRVFTKPE